MGKVKWDTGMPAYATRAYWHLVRHVIINRYFRQHRAELHVFAQEYVKRRKAGEDHATIQRYMLTHWGLYKALYLQHLEELRHNMDYEVYKY